MRKLATLAAIAGVAAAGAVATAGGAASAADPIPYAGRITQPTTSFSSPSQTSQAIDYLRQNTIVDTMCFREGQVIQDNALWFLIKKDGTTSWVHRAAISVSNEVPHC